MVPRFAVARRSPTPRHFPATTLLIGRGRHCMKGLPRVLQSVLMSSATVRGQHYRADGVRITHDPFAAGMAEKYGAVGQTDAEGFDPYRDSVGPGIYGGVVKRDAGGAVVVGRQYQNHNPRPGRVRGRRLHADQPRARRRRRRRRPPRQVARPGERRLDGRRAAASTCAA